MHPRPRRPPRLVLLAVAACMMGGGGCGRLWPGGERTVLEFRVRQDIEAVLLSDFGEPPQLAIWLEERATGRVRTVGVTRRSARGQWVGKSECPVALPRWFEIHRRETGRKGLPTPQQPAADAVTRATPKTERFVWQAEVEPGSRWVCWLEVNLAGDFNEAFPQLDEAAGRMDTHFCGQPSLLYRAEIAATPGTRVVPKLYGYTAPDTTRGDVQRDLSPITSARTLLKSIEIRVVRRRAWPF